MNDDSLDDVTLSSNDERILVASENIQAEMTDVHQSARIASQAHLIRKYQDENRNLRDEITQLRGREVQMASLAIKLQDQFSHTRAEIELLKSRIQTEVLNSVSEAEFFRLQQVSEEQRDITDTMRIAIFRQIGNLKSSRDEAVKRGVELAARVEHLDSQLRQTNRQLEEQQQFFEAQVAALKQQVSQQGSKEATIFKLTAQIQDLEHRLHTAHTEKESYFEVRMNLQAKINEVMRLELMLKEAQDTVRNSKNDAECAGEKLDILKAEYYEMKLQFSQRTAELESALRASEEKVQMLSDFETEAEIFMSNIAATQTDNTSSGALVPFDVPPSRRMKHTIGVTKHAMALENQLCAAKLDIVEANRKISKLRESLEYSRSAMSNSNAPYRLIERALEEKDARIEELTQRNAAIEAENTILHDRVTLLSRDVFVLSQHEVEIARLKECLNITADPPAQQQQETHCEPAPVLHCAVGKSRTISASFDECYVPETIEF